MNKRKTEFLGEPYGTAMARLRRKVMFALIVEAGKNSCHVCGFEMAEDTFSIEHLLPWEGRDAALFWDLSNITFSHKACNRPHGKQVKREVKGGNLWCPVCKQDKPTSAFNKNRAKKTGFHTVCRTCQRLTDRRTKAQQRGEPA